MSASEGDVLWVPSERLLAASRMTAWMAQVGAERDRRFESYDEAWRWSVEEPGAFWASIAAFFAVPFHTPPRRVLADASMPGAHWFEGATLNYA